MHSSMFKIFPIVMVVLMITTPMNIIAQNGPKLSPLPPKPGHVIGRVVDMQSRAILNIEIKLVGTLDTLTFEPDVDPQTGYYEIEVPDDLYRIHAAFNEATNQKRPQTIDCLLNSLDEFEALDGKGRHTRSNSKKGIVKDFVYVPRGC